jgi:hypothetical protein
MQMAFTNEDFTHCKGFMRNDAVAKRERKTAGLEKDPMKATFQAIETDYQNSKARLKAAMETASGETLSDDMFSSMHTAWMKRKVMVK